MQVLVVDEASMLSAEMWEKVEEKVRGNYLCGTCTHTRIKHHIL